MKKYDTYKDSGIEWIGEIPGHWEINQIRRGLTLLTDYDANGSFSTIKDNVNRVEDETEKYAWLVRATDLEQNKKVDKLSYEIVWVSIETWNFLSKSYLSGGELLVAKRGEIGKVYLMPYVDFPSTLGPNMYLARLNPRKILSSFAFYFFSVDFGINQLKVRNKSTTIGALYKDDFKDIVFIYPPLPEQTAIAHYLDRKTAEIDELIADKKRLLELYEEEKTAIINQAVTKGLNPDLPAGKAGVPMKDSGIEWLGEIPAHWEVKRLKMLVSKIGSGVTPSGGSSVYLTSGIPLLRSQNIHFDGLRLDDVAFISDEIDEGMSNSRIQEGDVLLNITGASIGRCFYIPNGFGKGNVNQHVCIIRPISQKVDTFFLYYLIRSEIGQTQINLQQTGANREGLNFEQLKNFGFPFPESIQEQQSIVRHIETECARIDAKKAKTSTLIALLTEYRTALISEVVTGKVKVIP